MKLQNLALLALATSAFYACIVKNPAPSAVVGPQSTWIMEEAQDTHAHTGAREAAPEALKTEIPSCESSLPEESCRDDNGEIIQDVYSSAQIQRKAMDLIDSGQRAKAYTSCMGEDYSFDDDCIDAAQIQEGTDKGPPIFECLKGKECTDMAQQLDDILGSEYELSPTNEVACLLQPSQEPASRHFCKILGGI